MWNLKSGLVVLSLSALALVGCSMQSARDGDSSLYLDLSSLRGGASRFSLTESGGSFYGLGSPPTTAFGFSCYAVNVTGPGIVDTSLHPEGNLGPIFDRLLRKESYCSYRGIVTPTFTLSASGPSQVALQVPPGGTRLIQLAGVNDPLVCARGVVDSGDSDSDGTYFEVGRAVLGDLFSDRSVDIAMDWPSTSALREARSMDCGDGSCGSLSAYAAGAPGSYEAIANPSTLIAIKLPTTPGKYIRKATIPMRGYIAQAIDTVDATVVIYEGPAASGISGASATSFSKSITLPQMASVETQVFDLRHNTFQYLQMQSGKDYWMVLYSADAATGTFYKKIELVQNEGGTGTVYSSSDGGSNWTSVSTEGVDHDVYGCGN